MRMNASLTFCEDKEPNSHSFERPRVPVDKVAQTRADCGITGADLLDRLAPVQFKRDTPSSEQDDTPEVERTNLPKGEADPTADPSEGLSNPRFKGDHVLEGVLRDEWVLDKGYKAASVRKVQAALEDLGYMLPDYHADGEFGSETETALKAFQAAEGVADCEAGVLDQPTMLRLDQRTPQAAKEQLEWREFETHVGPDSPIHDLETDDLIDKATNKPKMDAEELEEFKGAFSETTQPKQTRLTNPRFQGDPMLAMLMSGIGVMGRGTKGPHVWKVQMALLDMGFELGRKGADGGYGGDMESAVKAFQEAYNVPLYASAAGSEKSRRFGTEAGVINGLTMAAFDAYAPASAPTETQDPRLEEGHSPEYAELFADGRFEVTLAIGFDDGPLQAHIAKKDQAISYLQNELDFTMADPAIASPEQLTAVGLDPDDIAHEITYFTRTIQPRAVPHEVQVVVKLLAAAQDGSGGGDRLALFRKALEEDDSVLYTGHARAGTGPDFDPHDSTEGNYVMGNGYKKQYNDEIKGAENQLKATDFDEKYQLYQFWGCRTKDYRKHLGRRLRERGDHGARLTTRKDLVMTTKTISSLSGLSGTLAMLRGMMAEANTRTLTDMTNTANNERVTTTQGMK